LNEYYLIVSLPVKKQSFSKRSKNILVFFLWRKHTWIDFTGRAGIQYCDQNRIAFDLYLFSIANDPDSCLILIVITVAVLNREPVTE